MADPETPARKKSKRKRWTVLADPEEVTAEIMNELQSSREGIDKKLARYNDSFMQTQNKKRHEFIEYCSKRIHDLPKSMKFDVATQLLSSEDFATEMNFSEVHTSSANSLLTWSCSDTSMSDPSWRIRESSKRTMEENQSGVTQPLTMNWHAPVLQQYAEDTGASSTPRAEKLARTTRSSSKASSPPVPSSSQIAEPSGCPTSMALSEAGTARDMLTENEEDDEDVLSTSGVTISKPGRARVQETAAGPLKPEMTSTNERQAPAGREISMKTSSSLGRYYWSPEECATLRNLCHERDEALNQYSSTFWQDVSSQIPGRTSRACIWKWKEMRRGPRKLKTTGSSGTRIFGSSRAPWSEQELQKLAQCCLQPAKACDWTKVATQFPGRTAPACYAQYRKLEAKRVEVPNGIQSHSKPTFGSEEVHDEPEQANMATREGEVDIDENPDGENLAVL